MLQVQCAMLYKTKTFKPKGYLTFLLVTTTEKCTIPYLATFAVTLKGERNSLVFLLLFLTNHLVHSSYKVVLFNIKSLYIFFFSMRLNYLQWKTVETSVLTMWLWFKRSKL